ncbi:hypothetical protein SKAU_G00100730 [Synaphobranchus kaupii]|uniref:Uncharacterized protein n=1 Tax=Synaphobranchus kaupii TaxID=118154 RepID=A0A9Q1FZE1_SYNKA|nr:hypothetical protein SKAU_G00100730 [Synaphobranchus kaupii]
MKGPNHVDERPPALVPESLKKIDESIVTLLPVCLRRCRGRLGYGRESQLWHPRSPAALSPPCRGPSASAGPRDQL